MITSTKPVETLGSSWGRADESASGAPESVTPEGDPPPVKKPRPKRAQAASAPKRKASAPKRSKRKASAPKRSKRKASAPKRSKRKASAPKRKDPRGAHNSLSGDRTPSDRLIFSLSKTDAACLEHLCALKGGATRASVIREALHAAYAKAVRSS